MDLAAVVSQGELLIKRQPMLMKPSLVDGMIDLIYMYNLSLAVFPYKSHRILTQLWFIIPLWTNNKEES